jgi:hypothetical protein
MIIGIGNWVGKSGGIGYWTPQNFLTTNSASDNVAALNDALTNHRSIYISTPGVYKLNDTILLDSNTRVKGATGVIFQKDAD